MLAVGSDRVPDDAINQMHRFRDAITRRVGSAAEGPQRVRPVVGAFALYPGFFHQTGTNMEAEHPYFEEVEHVGNGAFRLLPHGRAWLTRYFKERFGVADDRIFAWEVRANPNRWHAPRTLHEPDDDGGNAGPHGGLLKTGWMRA